MILTKDEILRRVREKEIVITPFKKKNVGPASVDLSLGNEFRILKKGEKIKISELSDIQRFSSVKKGTVVLEPLGYLLGITKERIKLPEDVAGFLTTRSRFARFGLSVDLNSPLIPPGVDNKQVLEIFNASQNNIILKPGLKICQLTLLEAKGAAKYAGKFRNQMEI